jgi:hypothetical protein
MWALTFVVWVVLNAMPGLAFVNMCVPETGQRGRAFMPYGESGGKNTPDLALHFRLNFAEDADQAREHLLSRLVDQRFITVEILPGEASEELHAYVLADVPVFGCILAPMTVVAEMLTVSPYVVIETSSFQVIDDTTPESISAGLQTWIARVWPGNSVPSTITLRSR